MINTRAVLDMQASHLIHLSKLKGCCFPSRQPRIRLFNNSTSPNYCRPFHTTIFQPQVYQRQKMDQPLAGILAHAQELLGHQDKNTFMIGFAVVSAVVYFLYAAIDRLYKVHFHPLAKFPGPKEASLSQNWLLRVSEQGNPEHVFKDLHEKYSESYSLLPFLPPLTYR